MDQIKALDKTSADATQKITDLNQALGSTGVAANDAAEKARTDADAKN